MRLQTLKDHIHTRKEKHTNIHMNLGEVKSNSSVSQVAFSMYYHH